MKLFSIHESSNTEKLKRYVIEFLHKEFPCIPDIRPLVKHIILGCSNSMVMIKDDKNWWAGLIPLMAPIQEKELQDAYSKMVADIDAVLSDNDKLEAFKQELLEEGAIIDFLSKAMDLLKTIVKSTIHTISAGVAAGATFASKYMSHGGYGGYGGYGGHGGYGNKRNKNGQDEEQKELSEKDFTAGVNVKCISIFLHYIKPIADNYPPSNPNNTVKALRCPHCFKTVAFVPALAGKKVICPHCTQPMQMPPKI